ncbi:MAG TPA: hypothetical protein VF765_26805 [Polyangiaceae bacterium]
MRLTTTLGLALAVACSRGSPPAPPPDPAPALPLVVQAAPAPKPDPCSLAAGYRGSVMGHRVFARLAREGSRLYGRYFYEHSGIDLRLDGTLSAANAVHLTEGEPDAQSGRFEGACDASNGAIDGTWTGGATSGPFHLEPIAPGEAALAAVKRFTVSHRVKKPDPDGRIKSCSYSESRVELFGLRDATVEQAINRQGLEPFIGARLEIGLVRTAEKSCEGFGFEADAQQTLADSFRELATLEQSGSIDGGGAHPSELSFSRVTIDLRTGHPVTKQDVFVRDALPRVIQCALRAEPFDTNLDEDDVKEHFDAAAFDLTETGVHFFGQDYPHVMAALDGQGPVIGYDVLVRDGYLRTDSPVKRAWSAVTPAPKGKDWCPARTWSSWWR